jgi:hypothetical protein
LMVGALSGRVGILNCMPPEGASSINQSIRSALEV